MKQTIKTTHKSQFMDYVSLPDPPPPPTNPFKTKRPNTAVAFWRMVARELSDFAKAAKPPKSDKEAVS